MKLESKGTTLTAETLRDGIRFEIAGKDPDLAIQALGEFLTLRTLTQEEIEKEVRIIQQERPVRSNTALIAAGLWKQAFAEPDLMGSDEDLAKATPAALKEVFDSLFRPERMVAVIVGDIDQMKCVQAFNALFASLKPVGQVANLTRSPLEQKNEGVVPSASGVGRAVAIGSSSKAESLAVLAAALAVANEFPGTQVVFTPSSLGGLVSIVNPSKDAFDDLDRVVTNESARLFRSGSLALRLWAASTDSSLRDKARTYGQMLAHENFFRMQDLVSRAGQVSQSDFALAMNKFRSGVCIRVGGVR
jgi:hypothetical protein